MSRIQEASTMPLRCTITLVAFLFCEASLSADVTIYTWTHTRNGQVESMDKVHSGVNGMVIEQLDPTISTSSSSEAGGAVTETVSWNRSGDFVVLESILVMNDDREQKSMVLDPDNAPSVPNPLAGMAGPGGNDVMKQLQESMNDPAIQNNPAAQEILKGLMGGAAPGAQPTPAPQISPTGNTGTADGIDWEEVQVQMGSDTVVYRLADWSDIQGAELLVDHYVNMTEIYQSLMENSGLGQFMQGMQAWPKEISTYMVDERKIPIFIDSEDGLQQLTEITTGTLGENRFGPRFEIEDPLAGMQ